MLARGEAEAVEESERDAVSVDGGRVIQLESVVEEPLSESVGGGEFSFGQGKAFCGAGYGGVGVGDPLRLAGLQVGVEGNLVVAGGAMVFRFGELQPDFGAHVRVHAVWGIGGDVDGSCLGAPVDCEFGGQPTGYGVGLEALCI